MGSSYQRSLRFALASSRRPVPHSGCVRSFSSTRSTGKDIQEAYIIAAARTPVGVFNGAFASVPAPQLGATAIRAALSRTSLPHEEISAAYIGNVLSAGMGQAPARQAIIRAGLPQSLDATTVNKVCASGLKSVALAAQQIALGLERAVIAGGMENMSRVPYLAPRGSQYPGFGNVTLSDGMISDGLWDAYNNVHMGSCAERTALTYKLPRERQDAYAVSSYTRAQAAWDAGQFADEVAPVSVPAARKGKPDTEVKEDEQYRKLKLDKVPTLKPAFPLPPGSTGERSVTAANSSSFNDGAAALILTNAELARQYARDSRVLARVVSSADAALDPMDFPVAPAKAVPLALERAGLTVADISAWEINEAFACVVLANAQILGGLKDSSDGGIDKVNQRGGSIAIGHAIGSSGARILTTLLHTLKVGEYGCVGICNGGGAATALIVQRVDHV